MKNQESLLDIIARMTAKTITEVSAAYHHEKPNSEQTEKEPDTETEDSAAGRSYPFGTSFSDIIKFTKDVEVFTKHIDTHTRDLFRSSHDIPSDKQKGDK